MGEVADWSALPQHLLSNVFEQRRNALNNCAAACACTSWRAAINNTHIYSLHLHEDHSTDKLHWTSFLQAKASIGTMKLTSSHAKSRQDNSGRQHPDAMGDSLMLSIPLACSSLLVQSVFGGATLQYTNQPAALRHLTLASLQGSFPNVAHLNHLVTLDVDTGQHTSGMSFARCLDMCPVSLLELTARQFRIDWHGAEQQLHFADFKSLTSLKLANCYIEFSQDDFACLSQLRSLSLEDSYIFAAWLSSSLSI